MLLVQPDLYFKNSANKFIGNHTAVKNVLQIGEILPIFYLSKI